MMAPTMAPVSVDVESDTELRQWLVQQADRYNLDYVLIHADDGVIWGYFDSGQIILSSEVFGNQVESLKVKLRTITLQRARLFGSAGELLVWRADDGLEARLIIDNGEQSLERTHLLWGDRIEKQSRGFTLMREGQQGLYHAPPIKVPPGRRAVLKVRHYIDYDEQGQAFISMSRLVCVAQANKEEENGA